ncbi:LemA family protein [Carnobacteriaceae bacterium zg-ZUI252]|nr:LemA family protein [Carnobacteriaceae bacterium zg-ZUI252]
MKNKSLLIGCSSIFAILLVIGLFFVGQYNGLVDKHTQVQTAQSKIETALQRRYDLIPNVVNATKGYMTHEKEVFENIANARAKIGSSTTPQEQAQAQSELSSAVSRLLVLTENYPQLKANEQVNALIVELEGSENRVFVARNDYNTIASDYNRTIKSFPTVIFANLFGYKEVTLFNAAEGAQNAPVVDFNKTTPQP